MTKSITKNYMDFSDYSHPSLFKRYRNKGKNFWKLYTDSPFGYYGLILVVSFIIVGVLAPYLVLYNPNDLNVGDRFEGPTFLHPLGTDRSGSDIFSQMVIGTQISLMIGLFAAFISVVIGTTIGIFAGYYGGLLDNVLMRITDFFIQLPILPVMIIIAAFFGGGIQNLILVIGLLSWQGTARMVRSETLSIKERSYIESTKAIGAKDNHIILQHIFPNVIPLISANAILSVVDAIIAEAGLSFLGFGDSSNWSWGQVLYEAQRDNAVITGHWWHYFPPGLCIMLLSLGFALVSFSLNEVVNPRLRER